MSFNWFVLPFAIGFHFMLIVLIETVAKQPKIIFAPFLDLKFVF